MSRKMTPDQLGKKGEARFEEICADAGLVCNPATRDRNGWDAIVEWPMDETQNVTLDERQRGLSCFVQVKTKWADNDKVRFSLTALERLTKEVKPSFIVIFDVSNDQQFMGARVIHVDREIQSLVFEKLRKISRDGVSLSGKYLSLNVWKFGQKVGVNGSDFRSAVESCVGSGLLDYISRKDKLSKVIGYEHGFMNVTMELAAENSEHLEDALLGLRDISAIVTNQETTRFGIAIPTQMLPIGAGPMKLSIGQQIEGNLGFREYPAGPYLAFTGMVSILNQCLKSAPQGKVWAFKSNLVQLKFRHSIVDAQANFGSRLTTSAWKEGKKATVSEWLVFLKFMVLCSANSIPIWLSLSGQMMRKIGVIGFNIETNLKLHCEELIQILETVRQIIEACDANETQVTLDDICHFKQYLSVVKILLDPSLTNEEFEGEIELTKLLTEPHDLSVLVIAPLHFFGLSFAFCNRAIGRLTDATCVRKFKLKLLSLVSIEHFSCDYQGDDFNEFVSDVLKKSKPAFYARLLLQNEENQLRPQLLLFHLETETRLG